MQNDVESLAEIEFLAAALELKFNRYAERRSPISPLWRIQTQDSRKDISLLYFQYIKRDYTPA